MKGSALGLLLLCVGLVASCTGHEVGISEDLDPPFVPVTVRLVPSQPSYGVGDTVVVRVEIEDAADVASVAFRLAYDDLVLQFSHGTEGNFLSDAGDSVFLAAASADAEVVVGMSLLNATEGVSGNGLLMELHFQAIGAGNCVLTFRAAGVKNPAAQNLPASFDANLVVVAP